MEEIKTNRSAAACSSSSLATGNTWSSRRNFYYLFFQFPLHRWWGSPSHAMYPDDPHHPIQMSHQPVNERWNTTAVLPAEHSDSQSIVYSNPIAHFYLERRREGGGGIWNDVNIKGRERQRAHRCNICESYCLCLSPLTSHVSTLKGNRK